MQATTTSEQADEQNSPAERQQILASAPVASDIEFLLARARTIGIVEANAALSPFGIKARHYVVLSLAASQLHPSQRELAEFLHLDPSQIVATIDLLESNGWVERTPSPDDRRIKVLNVTPEGLTVHEEAKQAVRTAEGISLAALTQTEQDTLRQLLHRIAF